MTSPTERLAEFERTYALERRWADEQLELLPFQRQEAAWWNWYYWSQFDWRSMTKEEAKSMASEPKDKPKKK